MRLLPLLVITTLVGCGSSETTEESAPPAQPSRIEAGVHTANTARQEIEGAQAAAQARLDSQMRASADTLAP